MDTMITNTNEEAVENAVEVVMEETSKKSSLSGLKKVGLAGLGIGVLGSIGFLIYKKRAKKNAESNEHIVTVESLDVDCDEASDDNE